MPAEGVLEQLAAATGAPDAHVKSGKDEPRVLLVTTVDVGGGTSDRIEVRAGQNPEDVARAFCLRHNLPEGIVGPLAQHLEQNLRKAASRRLAGGSQKSNNSSSTPSADGGLDPPQPTKSPKLPLQHDQQAGAEHGSGGPGTGGKPVLSFGSGMDDRVYEQLSSKLMDGSQAPSARRGNWVNATEVLSGMNSKRSSSNISNPPGPGGPYPYDKQPTSPGPSPRNRDSVHLRLYATAQEKAARLEERRRMAKAEQVAAIQASRSSISWISAEMMRGRGAGGMYDNYGEMLYSEGVEALMARLKRAELERRAREDREMDGATFVPTITKKAWELKQRERSSCSTLAGDGSMGASSAEDFEKWQRLHMRGIRKSTQERMDSLRAQREEAELAECTFKPRINKNSDALMTERAETLKALNITHHEQLFADALRRQAKMEELQRWYPDGVTFQPQVNKDPRAQEYLRRSWDRQSKQGPPAEGSPQMGTPPSVVERLYAEAERKQAKLEQQRQLLHGPIDPVTNKPLFVPQTGRGPRGNHARNALNGRHIGEVLYQVAQDQATKRAAKEEEERLAAAEEAAKSRTTAVSQKLFTDLKLKRFRQIFEYLDEEGSGELDLLGALGRSPPFASPEAPPCRQPRVDNLDGEVLVDVEAAASVWARANGLLVLSNEEQHGANGSQQGGSFGRGTSTGSADGAAPTSVTNSAAPGTPRRQASFGSAAFGATLAGPCPPLRIEMFMSCMEEALKLRRGPRAYLVPSPSAKQAPAHTFRPAINPRSRALAAKSRPDTSSAFELLYRVAAKTAERLEALRREKDAAGMADCTFQPQLNINKNRSQKHARSASHDTSGFRAAAAGIAAAAERGQAADAERLDLQQQLQHLRMAAETAVDVQARLLAEAAAAAGGEGGSAVGVDEELERFSLLEKELRDMQALTQVAIDDHDRQQQLLQAQAAQMQAHQQQQQPRNGSGGGAGQAVSGSLQDLAHVLGVSSWDAAAATGGPRASA
ncbi:hypothetical protein GPECTOR_64g133 [Gonium pectorale]|uniref:PFU domain-containing protein n=1 Tax=Gonium pectorale TaxID=33097 RepID=A0A150G423_GONPE|nr:hypothetical protein GPECTOR_64g133 [Gonium pectorale]|eukprot:KXZ44639.1 hypothetical protein GPECTOR_64g133 [Gonium pectorale]